MASTSNGTLYINQLLVNGGAFNTDFSGVLTEVWDFADQTNLNHDPPFENNLSSVIVANVPIVTYWDPTTDGTPKPNPTQVMLPPPSWANYVPARAVSALEIPPLPGQDPSVTDDIHHRIRDLMFTDAAKKRTFGGGVAPAGPPLLDISFHGSAFHLARIDLGPVTAVEDPGQPQVSLGSGPHRTAGKLLATSPVFSNAVVNFQNTDVSVRLILYELRDQNEQPAAVEPNWFGVAVPDGINDYSRPIFYFHPTPGQNNYIDAPTVPPDGSEYHAKTAVGPKSGAGRDWRELFAYADRVGNQLAGAILQGASPNQIAIVPFMTTRCASPAGIAFLKANWLQIMNNILQEVATIP